MRRILLTLLFFGILGTAAQAEPPQWMSLPSTPSLPSSAQSGFAPINGVKIWYAMFGSGQPVILLHGGLSNSNYWGNLVPVLAKDYQVIVMDSRGHGRSGHNNEPLGYDLMASDVLALMNFLKLDKAAIVGWSDGAIIGLDIAIHHPERLTKLFAFGANSDPDGLMDISQSPVFKAALTRLRTEYQQLSPTPEEYDSFQAQVMGMWDTQPHFTAQDLHGIQTSTWIVDGDRDEAIKRSNTHFMADQIPDSGLLIEPRCSHFCPLQDPAQFNADVVRFLRQTP